MYKELKKNISKLRKEFLSFSKRLDGEYSESDLMKCRAYVAFAHAEIEHFLEAWAERILSKARSNWGKGRGSKTLLALLFYRGETRGVPSTPTEIGSNTYRSNIGKAISLQEGVIKSNHGITPENVAKMFIPLGFTSEDFDEPLLIQLKNFGGHRGDLVHKSSNISLERIRDPFDDVDNDINYLVEELEKLDTLLLSK